MMASDPQEPTAERRALLDRIAQRTAELGLTPRQVALQATGKVDLIRDLKRTKGLPSADRMEALARVLKTTVEWLLNGGAQAGVPVRSEVRGTGLGERDAQDAWAMPGDVAPVPLLGSAYGGEWEDDEAVELTELHLHEVLDYLARPPSLAHDPSGYAVEIIGESMAPRYEPGERAFVSPKAAAHPGSDVIVQLRGSDDDDGDPEFQQRVTMVLIKRLVRRTAQFVELRQFNPDRTFRVPIDRVAAIHRVRGRL